MLRYFVPSGQKPVGPYYAPELRTKVEQYKTHLPFDLMLTGSSVAAVNHSSSEITRASGALSKGISMFNAGIRGCNFICITPVLNELFLPMSQPDVLLIVVSPADLSETHAYRHRQSQKYRQAMSETPLQRGLKRLISDSFWLYGFRREILHLAKTRTWQYENLVEDLGYVNMGSTPRKWRNPALGFDMEGPASMALFQLVTDALERKIRVLILPALGSEELRETFPPKQKAQFFEILHQTELLVGPPGYSVQVMDELIPSKPLNYIDGVHLTAESAIIQSNALVKKLVELKIF